MLREGIVTVTTHLEDSRGSEYVNTSFLDTVDTESHSSWQVTVMVNNQPVVFEIDRELRCQPSVKVHSLLLKW